MSVPIAPLWGFFQTIRSKSPVPLAVDQYFFFFDAVHQLPIDDPEFDLRAFTKLFWLVDKSFEDEYDYYYNQIEPALLLLTKEKVNPVSTQTDGTVRTTTETDGSTSEAGEVDTKQIAADTDKAVQESGDVQETADLVLVLRDSRAPVSDEDEIRAPVVHNYSLQDSAILPFDARNFVQRLRRKVETAEQVLSDEIDVPAMISRYIETGFIDDVIYELEDASHSNVVLLADRRGSMSAYDFLESHFASGLRQIPHCDFQQYYFYNLPQRTAEGHYTMRSASNAHRDIDTRRHRWTFKTWIFILSDAGAHSGIVHRERMHATLALWGYLKEITPQVHWINPVPFRFLNDCTAKRLQMTIPMINPDQRELNNMIYSAKATR